MLQHISVTFKVYNLHAIVCVEAALYFPSQNWYDVIAFVKSLLVLTLLTSTHAISTNRIDLVCFTYHTITNELIKTVAVRILFRETANKKIFLYFVSGLNTGMAQVDDFSSWTALVLNLHYHGFWCQSNGMILGLNSHVSGLVIPDCLGFITRGGDVQIFVEGLFRIYWIT